MAGFKISTLNSEIAPFPAQEWRSFFYLIVIWAGFLEPLKAQDVPTRSNSIKGRLTPERLCYDVLYYRLSVMPDLSRKSIEGACTMRFKVLEQTQKIQMDLASRFRILSVLWENRKLKIERDGDAFFVLFPRTLLAGEEVWIETSWEGIPAEAVKPPWEGGFVWTQDPQGQPWVCTAVQNVGASAWWPCKDHPSDEPDSMLIIITVPKPLVAVANGWPAASFDQNKKKRSFVYRVSYPINLYNVCLNVGDYAELSSHYTLASGKLLNLHYYPLKIHADKAKTYFDEEVKPMLSCFEKYFGPYPFVRDGFALVETPFAGMEHQSAIAYGNNYQKGYLGKDYSGIGLDFDFIIVHEAGHEYWGNAVSGSDRADWWIHEGFCTYAEALYVECRYGPEKALAYMMGKKRLVLNDKPILPPRHVNALGSGDMYAKAALMLHTLRTATGHDSIFLKTLKDILDTFSYKTVDTETLLAFMERHLGWPVRPVCYQYLRHTRLPTLLYRSGAHQGQHGLWLRWETDEPDFALPVRWRPSKMKAWQTVEVLAREEVFLPLSPHAQAEDVIWDTEGMFILTRRENP